MDKVNFLREKSGDFTQIYLLPKINQNEFDNYDNYNLNLLLIKRFILRSRKTGFPTCSLDEFDPFPED